MQSYRGNVTYLITIVPTSLNQTTMNMPPDFSSLSPYAGPLDEAQIQSRFRSIAEQGGLRHALPAEFGGYGDGFADLRSTHRQLGLASRDPGLLLMVNAHLWGIVFPVLLYGNAEQKQLLLPQLISGQWLGGHAITEPSCGSDVQAMNCCAEQTDTGFVLNGE